MSVDEASVVESEDDLQGVIAQDLRRGPAEFGLAVGVHLGVSGELWRLKVTHPSISRVLFTGTITIGHGLFADVRGIQLEPADTFSVSGSTTTFSFRNASNSTNWPSQLRPTLLLLRSVSM